MSRGPTPSLRQSSRIWAALGGLLKRSTVSNAASFSFRKSTDFRQALHVGLRYTWILAMAEV
jgi:hypothetical protein